MVVMKTCSHPTSISPLPRGGTVVLVGGGENELVVVVVVVVVVLVVGTEREPHHKPITPFDTAHRLVTTLLDPPLFPPLSPLH